MNEGPKSSHSLHFAIVTVALASGEASSTIMPSTGGSAVAGPAPVIVTSDPNSLLKAVQVLISQVSELKTDNESLRQYINTAQTQIETLQQQNLKLTKDVTSHSKRIASLSSPPPSSASPPSSSSHGRGRSYKLRGTSSKSSTEDDDDSNSSSQYLSRLQLLEDKLACVSDQSTTEDIFFEGCNVHVRDGSGSTDGNKSDEGAEKSGLGNLIIGYNEPPSDDDEEAPEICSNSSTASDLVSCRKKGGFWGQGIQTGIHNLVIGSGHSYTQHSGIIAGRSNAITGQGATVLGGKSNVASGEYSTVTGGVANSASGEVSVVLGGFDNAASGQDSLVGGGSYNIAGGIGAAVLGGENNQAIGNKSFIAGGNLNQVLGEYSSTTSSFAAIATGRETSVSGGRQVVASLDETMIAGTIFGIKPPAEHHHEVAALSS